MALAGIGHSLEGVHAVSAALHAGRVTRLTVEAQRAEVPPVSDLVREAEKQGVEIAIVDDVGPLASTTAPQGVVARARPLPTQTLETLASAAEPAALLVLDRVEDPRNVGASVRSAAAAGLSGIVVAERRAAPLSAAAFKAAAGAFEHLGVAIVGSVADAVRDLGRLDVWTIGLDAAAERSLLGLDLLAKPVALVLGAEGRGLSRLVRERVDMLARIPLAPSIESLNVSAAATLAAFEVARVRGRIT